MSFPRVSSRSRTLARFADERSRSSYWPLERDYFTSIHILALSVEMSGYEFYMRAKGREKQRT